MRSAPGTSWVKPYRHSACSPSVSSLPASCCLCAVEWNRVMQPVLSVIIPVYNEEAGLDQLFERLYPALQALGISYEVLFVNDGSRDRSAALLAEQFRKCPDVTRVILF